MSQIADDVLKVDFDSARIVYNRFVSAMSFRPTIATVLSPDVLQLPSTPSLECDTASVVIDFGKTSRGWVDVGYLRSRGARQIRALDG